MSYTSISKLENGTSLRDVQQILEFLNYEHEESRKEKDGSKIKTFYWFESKNYKSWTGVILYLIESNGEISVSTKTSNTRSYYDLEHQNKTIRLLRKYFKGDFTTDYGKGRYLNTKPHLFAFPESGCHQAFSNFGTNLFRAHNYLNNRNFGNYNVDLSGIDWLDRLNPSILSNTLVLPFLCSIAEDFWKSLYIVLLKYSDKKESILKSNRISPERLTRVSNQTLTIEEAFAESIPFGRISMVCKHFNTLDKNLHFARELRKPYRRRKKSLYDSLEEMTEIRNKLIHRASTPILIEDKYLKDLFNIIHDSVERCYTHLIETKEWSYYKTWNVPKLK